MSKSEQSRLSDAPDAALKERFAATRALSEALVEPLSEADVTIQSMEDASPAKWHLAHTTWFWETFLLRDQARSYQLYDDRYPFLFNSYYEAEGARHTRAARGMLSRPSLADILEWRAHVDAAMESLLADPELAPLIELGVAHEQQHIELLLTDIKHAFFQNPIGPAMWTQRAAETGSAESDVGWHSHPGAASNSCEKPVWATSARALSSCVTIIPLTPGSGCSSRERAP